jgi:hypothetical protein
MNGPDEVETWWTRCVVIYSSPFESARARVRKKSDTTPRGAVFGPSCRAHAFTRDVFQPHDATQAENNRDRVSDFYRCSQRRREGLASGGKAEIFCSV